MARKNFLQVALDNLKEALQSFSIRRAVETRDKRSSQRGKRIVKELGKDFSDSEIAAQLEISRQKYTALKQKVKKGKVSSSTLNDLLEEAGEKARAGSSRPRQEEDFYTPVKPVGKKKKYRIDFEEMGDDYIKKNIPWAREIKPGGFRTRRSALNWYGQVTGGKEYFKIVRRAKYKDYTIYDVRTASELSRKGEVSGKLRAERILERDRL